jgi:hypothetical protein
VVAALYNEVLRLQRIKSVAMPVVVVLTVIIQACFIFHVFKTGRPYWWAFVILAFPALGCIVYYLVEVFPNSREHRAVRKTARKVAQAVAPDAEFMRRVEEVEICGSVENKAALAEECLGRGLTAEAVRLYEQCAAGPYAGDPKLRFGLAQACLADGQWARARDASETLARERPEFRPNEVALLRARALEGDGETGAARQAYERLLPGFVGLEARYRYAMLLQATGHGDAARAELQTILAHAKRFQIRHEEEQEWVAAARRGLEAG